MSEIINCTEDAGDAFELQVREAHLGVPAATGAGRQNSLPPAKHSPEAAKRAPSSAMHYQAAHPSEETQALTAPLGYFLDGDGYFWNIFVTALSTS